MFRFWNQLHALITIFFSLILEESSNLLLSHFCLQILMEKKIALLSYLPLSVRPLTFPSFFRLFRWLFCLTDGHLSAEIKYRLQAAAPSNSFHTRKLGDKSRNVETFLLGTLGVPVSSCACLNRLNLNVLV